MVLHCISTGVDGTALYQHRCRWYCIVSARACVDGTARACVDGTALYQHMVLHISIRRKKYNERLNNIGYAMLMSINDCEMKGAKKVILVLSSMAPIL